MAQSDLFLAARGEPIERCSHIGVLRHAAASQRLSGRAGTVAAPEQMFVAEIAIAIAAMRATFGRAAELVDAFHAAHAASDAAPEEWHSMFAEVQAAKTFVNESAVRVVDRAMLLSGGAGYMRSHVLSRAFRDARAGAFMQPLGSLRAYDYLARASLGLEPSLS